MASQLSLNTRQGRSDLGLEAEHEAVVRFVAVIAEHVEVESRRTTPAAALAAAKARGVKLGNPNLRAGSSDAAAVARDAHGHQRALVDRARDGKPRPRTLRA